MADGRRATTLTTSRRVAGAGGRHGQAHHHGRPDGLRAAEEGHAPRTRDARRNRRDRVSVRARGRGNHPCPLPRRERAAHIPVRHLRESVDKIRKRTKLVVMTSTSGIAGQTDEDRATPLKTRPEMGSLTTGTLNFAGRKPAVVYLNTPETGQFLAMAILGHGIKIAHMHFDTV